MKQHKLVLDEIDVEEFSLIAIHCSEEPYKMAFLLNQSVKFRLKRKAVDLAYSNNGLEISFPHYVYNDALKYRDFHLISNKCKSPEAIVHSSGSLFENTSSEKFIVTYLLPEHKKADYILKIYSDFENIPLRKFISEINEIKQVVSAYSIDVESIKSKNNLIFD